jgi:hypothetical protein
MAMLSSRMPIAALAGAILTLSLSSSLAHGATVPADAKRITNETTRSHWVNPNDRGVIRNAPDSDSGAVARLKLNTEDGLPNVYLVLREWTDEDNGDVWFQVRIPQRPNGKTGWVREESVGPLQRVTTQLIVNRKTLRATLFRKGRKIFSTRVGVGKASTPTPGGRFWIREKLVLGGGHGVYGPLAFGTSAYSDKLTDWPKGGVVGIHGTNQPGLIPGRPSHGCIRMRNKAIKRLGRLMPIGTPLRVI